MKNLLNVFKALLLMAVSAQLAFAGITDEASFTKALVGKKTSDKELAIDWVIETQTEDVSKPILDGWLNGNLYYFNDKQSEQYKQLYLIQSIKTATSAQSVWDESSLSIENARQFKKVRVNNKLRGILRGEIASIGLNSSNPDVRYKAVLDLLGTKDSDIIDRLAVLRTSESEGKVAELMDLSLAIFTSLDKSATVDDRVVSIDRVGDFKHSVVLKTLNQLLNSEQDPKVLAAAERAMDDYQQSQALYSGVETVFFGLSLGSVLVLAGIGLAITFGVMGVINMAHGELIMIGAYTTYVLQLLMPNHIGLALILSIPAAFIVSGLVGIAIERSVIRHLYGRPLETLLATFGISLILQQAVRSIFSPLNRSVSTPEWMSGALQLNPMLSLTYNRLYIILFCGLVFMGLLMVLKKTPLGLQVRAVSQNRGMARAMGIRSERVDAMTFGLGSGVAGVAGVALSQLTNVGPNMGQAYIIDSFMVVVFGGVGNLWGTLVAGMSLGLFNKILEPWAGAVLAKILVLVFIILFIQKRPRGLFPQRGRAAEG
ncbi:amino acid/amide ABC transporter membrane protein 1 (HAAT family) [Vibrio crassostreae]|uniref:urea ABC transporter permease subunit UrtB n=1 Tax=Vibrio crassostreae TaxID=246167 RepID=UPI000F471F8C|nr:urea ABC transporter permease subunit UrtB [Vibrio crassostreae]ROO64945.1 amino acid/amide ABC transporter membrane protein 1 (HAAT family) [Vibrio crassostreae]ROP02402.1 amino acid/amide ABC transporter membrane protein 1 (HAAT family) [Vibrio crassostreae]ROQ71865.1 amino acid/amide ABC transporter membrane protein 1 (HAAT family) [Vibrio crassostreae]ROR77319.1 amino acid/amide ABC transporter membrane protein 1 (HAAT family) [Vibrio crassostreae]RPE87326.1 amino acid/amide ABC transpo